jgi:hypothetical protein
VLGLFLQSSELGPPTSLPVGECAPPPFGSGGAHSPGGEGEGVGPNSDEGTYACDTLGIYVLFAK